MEPYYMIYVHTYIPIFYEKVKISMKVIKTTKFHLETHESSRYYDEFLELFHFLTIEPNKVSKTTQICESENIYACYK